MANSRTFMEIFPAQSISRTPQLPITPAYLRFTLAVFRLSLIFALISAL